jgi:hypothetical protein
MVCMRMGLLDEAIRDHLELKRLRGADPGEVAREQREALDPALTEEVVAVEDDALLALEDFVVEAHAAPPPVVGSETDPVAAAQAAHAELANGAVANSGQETANGGQETAELDMQAVLAEEEGLPIEHGAPDGPITARAMAGPDSAENLGDDQLEWEIPGEGSSGSPAGPDATITQ